MALDKKFAFTLSEVLMTVVIVGVIAILILPSVTKNIYAKTRMSLLKNTIAELSNVIQQEMTSSRAVEVTMTNIVSDPQAFLSKFDTVPSGEAFASSYRKYTGSGNADVVIPEDGTPGQAKVLLKNGVGIGIVNKLYGKDSTGVIIDVTGNDKPNIVGVDYFILQVFWDSGEGWQTGDVGAYSNSEDTASVLKTSCIAGNGASCFRMVELSGYEPDYLK